jgi:thiol:disulfide interchange protein
MPPLMLCPDFKAEGTRYTQKLQKVLAGQGIDESAVSTVNWEKDYGAAIEKARKSGKLLLVEIGASWCGLCQKMDDVTYSDPDVVEKLNGEFVPLKIDLDTRQGKDLAAKHKFNAVPTALILDAQENLKQKLTGFRGPEKFINELSSVPKE